MAEFLEKFLRYAELHPDDVAFHRIEDNRKLSYGALRIRIEKMASTLRLCGVSKGDRVAIVLPAVDDFACVAYACFSIGAVVVPFNSTVTLFELEQLLAVTKPVGIVSTASLVQTHSTCLFEPRELRFVLTLDKPVRIFDFPSSLRFECFDEESSPSGEFSLPSSDWIASCHFTYKGLGYPLPVEHRASDYDVVLEHLQKLSLNYSGRNHLVLLPVYAIFGLVACVLVPLAVGHTLILADRAARVNPVEAFVEYDVSFAGVVPDILVHMNRKLRKAGKSFVGKLREDFTLFCGASYLPHAVAQETFELLGVEPIQGFGTTEALICISTTPGNNPRGTLGHPVRGVEIRVVDAFDHDLGAGQMGELLVRGPCVSQGFAGCPRESSLFFSNGWFRTGDLVVQDEAGNLFYKGTRASFTKVGSQMVDLAELEGVALRHPSVARAKVFVETDDHGMASMVFYVVTKRRKIVNDRELYHFIRAHLSPHKVPKHFRFFKTQRVSDDT